MKPKVNKVEIYEAVPSSADERSSSAIDNYNAINRNDNAQYHQTKSPILRIVIFLLVSTTLLGAFYIGFPCFSSNSKKSGLTHEGSYNSIFNTGRNDALQSFSGDIRSDIFQGVFTDPNHPQGYRLIVDVGDTTARLELRDDLNGEIILIPVAVVRDSSTTQLLIDFSSKGGPKDLVATVLEGGDISFSDGNIWNKTEGIPGVYYTASDDQITGHLTIRLEEGGTIYVVYVEMENEDGSGGKDINVPATLVNNNTIMFDFSNDGGPNHMVSGIFQGGAIYFEDGNTLIKV